MKKLRKSGGDKGLTITSAWKKVHPDLKPVDAFVQFGKLCPQEHTTLFRALYTTAAQK